MEERKPMYEFNLGFMGKIICSADTAAYLQGMVTIAREDAKCTNTGILVDAYDEVYTNIHDTLKSVGYYNEVL